MPLEARIEERPFHVAVGHRQAHSGAQQRGDNAGILHTEPAMGRPLTNSAGPLMLSLATVPGASADCTSRRCGRTAENTRDELVWANSSSSRQPAQLIANAGRPIVTGAS